MYFQHEFSKGYFKLDISTEHRFYLRLPGFANLQASSNISAPSLQAVLIFYKSYVVYRK